METQSSSSYQRKIVVSPSGEIIEIDPIRFDSTNHQNVETSDENDVVTNDHDPVLHRHVSLEFGIHWIAMSREIFVRL